jgi:hypothetical protein
LFGHVLKRSRLVLSNWRSFAVLTAILFLAPGMKARVFRARESAPEGSLLAAIPTVVPAPPLVQLPTGTRLEGQGPPAGWSHLVVKPIPRLATGDLETVSAQAFETAQRIRLTIVADVRRSPSLPSSYVLDRVGVGLCVPAEDGHSDVVVSPTSLGGARGPWTAKQRIILAAASLELSGIRLAAATPTFALIKTPVTFLTSGAHRKIDVCYALFADPMTGELRTLAWTDDRAASPGELALREFSSPVFDCPLDVHATRVASIPVAWSFAMRDLPPGTDLSAPAELVGLLDPAAANSVSSGQLEQALLPYSRKKG